MHPYETASDSFIGDDQYHLRRDPSLFTLFFQNKRHKHKIFFPRILDAMSISVCAESHITNFYRIFFAIIIVNALPLLSDSKSQSLHDAHDIRSHIQVLTLLH